MSRQSFSDFVNLLFGELKYITQYTEIYAVEINNI